MKSATIFLTCLSALIATFLHAQDLDYRGLPEWSWGHHDSTQYMIYIPDKLEAGKKYPIALFMHGCCGKSYDATERNEVDPPARMWHNFGADTQKIPTYIISPATSRGWSQHFDNLKFVIDSLILFAQGDPKRIYVTGFSMGGGGTWQIIQKYPGYFAAAIPMGMDFRGDPGKVKDIPIWSNQGETDWFSRGLKENIARIRALNGDSIQDGATWVTGVNPRYSNFKGVGHGVQWAAASTQNLTGWAYSKINDGNVYPLIFFESPEYKKVQTGGEPISIRVNASDPDGRIDRVDILIDGKLSNTLKKNPYETSIIPDPGDTKLEAVAYDKKGKSTTAQTIVRVNNKPTLNTETLPYGRVGALYEKQVFANGNQPIRFAPDYEIDDIPDGLSISADGMIRGIPVKAGNFPFSVVLTDEDGDQNKKTYQLKILDRREGEVVITHAMNKFNSISPVSKVRLGETPNYNTDGEINFSKLNGFEDYTLIQTDSRDTEVSGEDYLSFVVDRDVTVYVGYEKYDNRFSSTIPAWLKDWDQADNKEIVAQYRYFDIYKKDFPEGLISLPGGNIKENKIRMNYFVMVRIPEDMNYSPEINTGILSSGKVNKPFRDRLTCLYGKGKVTWEIVTGELPIGIKLDPDGNLSGLSGNAGKYTFMVKVTDQSGKSDTADLSIRIE